MEPFVVRRALEQDGMAICVVGPEDVGGEDRAVAQAAGRVALDEDSRRGSGQMAGRARRQRPSPSM
jgi:hypothetical protein